MAKRKDRSEKLKERNNLSETVVKCTLKRLLLGSTKGAFIEAVQKRVDECSERYHNASLTLNYLVRELFDQREDVAKVELPDFWDPTFVRQALLGTKEAHKPEPFLTSVFERHPCFLSSKGRSQGDRNIYTFAAIKLSTNIKNHLILNFPNILKTYLYETTALNKAECVEVQRRLYGWNQFKPKKNKTEVKIDENNVLKVLGILREIVGDQPLGDGWFKVKDHLKNMLRFFVFVSRQLEEMKQKDPEIALFTILPVCRMRHHFTTMDTSVLFGILKDIGVLETCKVIEGLEQDQWKSVLNTHKICPQGAKFTGTIDTDGLAVCVHFQRPKKTTDMTEIDVKGKRIIAVDPGRRNIFTMVEKTEGQSWKTYTLTRGQYYEESGMTQVRKKTQKWNQNVRKEIEAFSKVSTKGQSLSSFRNYLDVWKTHKGALWKEYTKSRWNDTRFKLFGSKKRTFANFLNQLGDPSNIVLAFGSAKFASGGKGEMSVPTTRAFKECSYRFPIKLVDEFRTSKIFWKDDSVLQTVHKKNPKADVEKRKTLPVHGLLWCCSTNQSHMNKFVNRDVNAAKNIYRCAVQTPRPSILDRRHCTGALPKSIGKVLEK